MGEHEASVYLALVMLGPASALDIANASGVKRTTVYSILSGLRRQGLVHEETIGLKRRFVAEAPEKLALVIESRKEQLRQALPQLNALYNLSGEQATIRHYKGGAAVRSVYEELLSSLETGDSYYVVTNIDRWLETDRAYLERFMERRGEKARLLGTDLRVLLAPSESAPRFERFQENYAEAIKILPDEGLLELNLVVTSKMLVMHQVASPVSAIVIQNKSIIKAHQDIFRALWDRIG